MTALMPIDLQMRRPSAAPPSSFALETEWLTATGRSGAAISDGGYFDVQACGDQETVQVGNIVSADSVGAPAVLSGRNVFEVRMLGGECCTIQKQNVLPASTTHWGRFAVRNDENQTSNTHPVAYNNIHGENPIQAVPFQRFGNHGNDSQWQIGVPTGGSYPDNRFYTPNLDIGAWYWFEWMMEYLTATTFRFWPRLRNAAGTLLYDASTFQREGGGLSLQQWHDASPSNVNALGGDGPNVGSDPSVAAAQLARHFGIGNPGPSGAPSNNLPWWYGSPRLSATGWIGVAA